MQPLDQHLLRAYSQPRVITAHDVLPREPRPGQLDAQRQLYERMDAIVVHTEHGRARLVDELGLPAGRVHVIPHGILRPAGDAPLPPELPRLRRHRGAVLRPAAALQGHRRARRGVAGASSTPSCGSSARARMDTAALRAAAPPGVRFVERFVSEGEAAALFRRADLAVLPYREIEQSGVLYTALGFGVPLVLSDVGGFPEIAAAGAAELVAPGDAAALHDALVSLLERPRAPRHPGDGARCASPTSRYGWDAIARAHLELYDTLLA